MGRGQFFGEVELLQGGRAIATIRADARTGADVAVLDRQEFQALLTTSAAVREAIEQVARQREAENLAAQRRVERRA